MTTALSERVEDPDDPRAHGPEDASRARRARSLGAGLALLALALLLQALTGAYTAEFTIGADDPSHFVSALMIRDYLAHGLAQHPVEFARDYYAHYPKVAVGNWPPVFHALQAAWMLVLPARPASAFLLLALMGAATAWLAFRRFRLTLGTPLALLGAALFLALPPVPRFLGMVMAEIPLTLFCTVAVLAWARFLDGGGGRWVAAFAAFTVLAVLTKANGLLLFLVPPLSILIGGRWRLLRSTLLWKWVAVAAVFTVPWIWWFLPTMRAGWASIDGLFGDVGEATAFYLGGLPWRTGWVALALAVVGAWHRLRPGAPGRDAHGALWASAAGAIVATLAFHVLAPAGNAMRHLIPAYPFLAMLTAAGVGALASAARRAAPGRPLAALAAAAVAVAAIAVEVLPISDHRAGGYGAAAALLAARADPDPLVTLVSSDPTGEGAFVAEMAIRDPARPRDVVWRATKLLSTVTWAGRDYVQRVETEEELLRLLDQAGVEAVVLDRAREPFPHQKLLARAIAAHPARFRLRHAVDALRSGEPHPGAILVYDVVRDGLAPPDTVLRQVPGYLGIEPRAAAAPAVSGAGR